MPKHQIKINQFVPVPNRGLFQGFINLKLNNEIELNSIGVYLNTDGSFRITQPGRKLGSGLLKLYFKFDSELREEITNEIKKYIEATKMWEFKIKEPNEAEK